MLKDFRNSIHQSLKIIPQNGSSNCFIVKEDKKESVIREIQITFTNQDDILLLRQEENKHVIKNILEGISTNCSCDFIIFLNKKEQQVIFCEIKSSKTKEYMEEAILQINSSKLFVSYLLESYTYFCKTDIEKLKNMESKSFYIYPKLGMPAKTATYKSDNTKDILYLKPVEVKDGRVIINNGYEFFGDIE